MVKYSCLTDRERWLGIGSSMEIGTGEAWCKRVESKRLGRETSGWGWNASKLGDATGVWVASFYTCVWLITFSFLTQRPHRTPEPLYLHFVWWNVPPLAAIPCPRSGSSLKDILDLTLINFGPVVPCDIPPGETQHCHRSCIPGLQVTVRIILPPVWVYDTCT